MVLWAAVWPRQCAQEGDCATTRAVSTDSDSGDRGRDDAAVGGHCGARRLGLAVRP